MRRLAGKSIATLLLMASLSACAANTNRAPIVDRYNPSEQRPDYYVVSRGDTLFSIAFRYGLDVQGLAAANTIRAPYTIYPGQRLRLREGRVPAPRPSVSTKPIVASKPPPKAVSKSPSKPKTPPLQSAPANESWRWPAVGPVLRAFVATSQAHKGIDIKGKMGESVKASRSGTVVYAGSGLVGYGNLLILKHSERYLSAYGHNRRLLVKEGDIVKAGQVIAELGDSGTDTAKLHFEIRVDGKPVDPLRLLPRR